MIGTRRKKTLSMVGYRIVICTILLGGMNHYSSSALVLIKVRHSSRKSQADHCKPYHLTIVQLRPPAFRCCTCDVWVLHMP